MHEPRKPSRPCNFPKQIAGKLVTSWLADLTEIIQALSTMKGALNGTLKGPLSAFRL